MRKLSIFLLLVIIFGINANAQQNVRFGVVAGANVSKFSSALFHSRLGFHLGVRAEVPLSNLSENVYLESSALISLKGAKIDWGDLGKYKYNPYYLEIPIHIGYKHIVTDNFAVFGSAGPYLAVGLFGKAKFNDNIDLLDIEESDVNLFGNDAMKRFDFGLGVKAGLEFNNKYRLSIGYDSGLNNIIKDNDEDIAVNIKNRNLHISFGYMF